LLAPRSASHVIEEPDWRGNVARFGSAVHLLREIVEIRDFIKAADAAAITAPESDDQDVLAAAWKAADMIHRLASLAVLKHPPFWTTG
jgi:hypothetical protein